MALHSSSRLLSLKEKCLNPWGFLRIGEITVLKLRDRIYECFLLLSISPNLQLCHFMLFWFCYFVFLDADKIPLNCGCLLKCDRI